MDEEDLKSLTSKQVLQGIEDIVREKFGWKHAYIVEDDGAISGMVVGIPDVVSKVLTPPQRKGTLQ